MESLNQPEGSASNPTGPARPDRLDEHPDLNALGKQLRADMDDTLRAEQYAARVAARRRSTMRDRLLLAEDRGETVALSGADGSTHVGVVVAVGADHVVLSNRNRMSWVALYQIVSIGRPPP